MFFGKKKQKEVLQQLEHRSTKHRYWKMTWKRFRKNKMALWALRTATILFIIGLFGPFLANEKPLYAKIKGQHHFPAFKGLAVQAGWSKWDQDLIFADWVTMDYESVLRTPIPYHANYIDKSNPGKSPFSKQELRSLQFRHWMGTDELGRDVAAGMVSGAGISLMVSVFTMFIASIIGLFFGSIAGYFGDGKLQISRIRLWLNILGFFLGLYYSFGVRAYLLLEGDGRFLEWIKRLLLFFLIMFLVNGLAKTLERFSSLNKKTIVGLDLFIMRFIEALNTIPGIFLLLAALPLFSSNSIFNIILILGLLSWTSIAKFVRGELLRVRSLQYIEAAQALGYPARRIILKHALPNALTPVLIAIAFGMAGAILAESTLSFLGIGSEEISWGKLLAKGRNHFSFWWLTLFPGFAIFLTVTIFNLIGDGLSKALK